MWLDNLTIVGISTLDSNSSHAISRSFNLIIYCESNYVILFDSFPLFCTHFHLSLSLWACLHLIHRARILFAATAAMNSISDQLTMTKTFRQQNVRLMLQIELRGINKNLSESAFRIINQLLTKCIHCYPFFRFFCSFYRVLVSIVSSVKKGMREKGNEIVLCRMR